MGFKESYGIIWAVLAVILIAGLGVHSADWGLYWALYATEVLAILIIVLYAYSSSQTTAIIMTFGGLFWFINQLFCWYYGELASLTFSQSMVLLNGVYIFTMVVEGILLGIARLHRPLNVV